MKELIKKIEGLRSDLKDNAFADAGNYVIDRVIEIIKDELKVTCVVCGKKISESAYRGDILCSSECHTKNYWNKYVYKKDELEIARINGVHYVIADENDNGCFRGYNGQNFTIKFNDGRLVKTSNLWLQGAIPDEYKEVLIDNAEFA